LFANSRTESCRTSGHPDRADDVPAKQGNIKDALAKYDEGLKYAPNWKQLKEAREVVAEQKS
jgi:hypothetical protein